jgi:hypothetical protein
MSEKERERKRERERERESERESAREREPLIEKTFWKKSSKLTRICRERDLCVDNLLVKFEMMR